MSRLINLHKHFTKSFCTYLENKKLVKVSKLQNSFKPTHCKLKQINVNLKDLVPNFFSNAFNIYECQKIIVKNKTKNHIENSYIQWQIPLSKSQQLQNTLIRFKQNQVRIGRILQIMDSVAGYVAYRHCFCSFSQENNVVVVTGSVDSLHLFEVINKEEDIMIEGYINYTGHTSMEVSINLFQSNILKANSLFTMISRNPNLNKGHPVPGLDFSTLPQAQQIKAQKRYQEGILNTERRKKQMRQSYDVCAPSKQELQLIHKSYLTRRKDQILMSNLIPISQTKVTNYLLMHVQQRNVHGKIFGGFLMREMLELGWFAGMIFSSGESYHIQDITNIYFKQAVEVGSGLKITAQITFVSKNIIVATVQAYTLNVNTKLQKMSCFLHIILKTKSEQKKTHPEKYQQVLQHLSAKKAFQNIFQ